MSSKLPLNPKYEIRFAKPFGSRMLNTGFLLSDDLFYAVLTNDFFGWRPIGVYGESRFWLPDDYYAIPLARISHILVRHSTSSEWPPLSPIFEVYWQRLNGEPDVFKCKLRLRANWIRAFRNVGIIVLGPATKHSGFLRDVSTINRGSC
jgi:hypothetical protein